MAKSKVIGEIHRTHLSKVIIQEGEYRGVKRLDIRLWVKAEDDWIATKSGVSIPSDNIPDFKEIIKKIKT